MDKLYLTTSNYNIARVFTALAEIVKASDGNVKPSLCKANIVNRTLSGRIREIEYRMSKISERLAEHPTEIMRAHFAKLGDELKELVQINNEPIYVSHRTEITFSMDGYVYHYFMGDNPFFPAHMSKTPVKEGKYNSWALCEEAPKAWLYDCLFSVNCCEADIREIAQQLYNEIMMQPVSTTSTKRVRVSNTYDSGYHYENIPEVKMVSIDW